MIYTSMYHIPHTHTQLHIMLHDGALPLGEIAISDVRSHLALHLRLPSIDQMAVEDPLISGNAEVWLILSALPSPLPSPQHRPDG